MNMFDLNPQYAYSHFLHLRMLNFLHSRMSYETTHGPGFVEIDSIIQNAEAVSTTETAIEWSLKELAYFGLVQFENQSNTGYDTATYVRITNSGIYYLKELVRRFVYLDLMWIDTPIADPMIVKELLHKLVELEGSKASWHLQERFSRTEIFLNYLSKTEKQEFGENPEFTDSVLTKTEFMPNILKSYKEEKDYIESKRQ